MKEVIYVRGIINYSLMNLIKIVCVKIKNQRKHAKLVTQLFLSNFYFIFIKIETEFSF
jgi:hypothetical protein